MTSKTFDVLAFSAKFRQAQNRTEIECQTEHRNWVMAMAPLERTCFLCCDKVRSANSRTSKAKDKTPRPESTGIDDTAADKDSDSEQQLHASTLVKLLEPSILKHLRKFKNYDDRQRTGLISYYGGRLGTFGYCSICSKKLNHSQAIFQRLEELQKDIEFAREMTVQQIQNVCTNVQTAQIKRSGKGIRTMETEEQRFRKEILKVLVRQESESKPEPEPVPGKLEASRICNKTIAKKPMKELDGVSHKLRSRTLLSPSSPPAAAVARHDNDKDNSLVKEAQCVDLVSDVDADDEDFDIITERDSTDKNPASSVGVGTSINEDVISTREEMYPRIPNPNTAAVQNNLPMSMPTRTSPRKSTSVKENSSPANLKLVQTQADKFSQNNVEQVHVTISPGSSEEAECVILPQTELIGQGQCQNILELDPGPGSNFEPCHDPIEPEEPDSEPQAELDLEQQPFKRCKLSIESHARVNDDRHPDPLPVQLDIAKVEESSPNKHKSCVVKIVHVVRYNLKKPAEIDKKPEFPVKAKASKPMQAKSKQTTSNWRGIELVCLHSRCKGRVHDFKNKESLMEHVRQTHKDVPVQKLNRNGSTRVPPANYICGICGQDFTYRSLLVKHQTRLAHQDGGVKTWPCTADRCPEEFTSEVKFKRHLKKIHEQPLICPYCLKTFTHRSMMNKHVNSHQNLKLHVCERCGESYTTSHQLRNHCGRLHPDHFDLPSYKCDDCDKAFTGKQSLTQHRRLFHLNEYKYECGVCGYKSMNRLTASNHELVHTKVKAVECDICHARFARKQYLKEHRLKHTGEKSFSCGVCEKAFSSRQRLTRHEMTHQNKTTKTNVKSDASSTAKRSRKKRSGSNSGRGRGRGRGKRAKVETTDTDTDGSSSSEDGQDSDSVVSQGSRPGPAAEVEERLEVQEAVSQVLELLK